MPPSPGASAKRAGRHIYDLLRSQIADGTLSAGAQVPSTTCLGGRPGGVAHHGHRRLRAARSRGLPCHVCRSRRPRCKSAGCSRIVRRETETAKHECADSFGLRPPRVGSGHARACACGTLPHRFSLRRGGDPRFSGAGVAACLPGRTAAPSTQALAALRPKARHRCAARCRATFGARGAWPAMQSRFLWCTAHSRPSTCVRGLLLNAGDAFVFEEPGYPTARRCFEAIGRRGLGDTGGRAGPEHRHAAERRAHPPGLRDALAPVSAGGRAAHRPAPGAAPSGANAPRLGDRGRLRRGVSLRPAADRRAAVHRHRWPRDLHRHLLRGAVAAAPAGLPGAAARTGAGVQAGRAAGRPPRARAGAACAGVADRQRCLRCVTCGARAVRTSAAGRHCSTPWRRHLPASATVIGAAAGLHVVLWLPLLRPQDEPPLVAAVRAKGVGVYAVSPLFAGPPLRAQPRPAGLILGYASLSVEEIDQGMRVLADADRRAGVRPLG